MSEVSDIRNLLSDTGWSQWVSDAEAESAADIIIRSTDPGDILKQLSAKEIKQLAQQLPGHKKQQLLDDLARDLRADTMSAEQRATLRENFKELGKAFGYDAVLGALDRHGTQQTKLELVKAFVQDTLSSDGNVSHDKLLKINKMLEGIPANQRGEVIASLSDQELQKWASEIGAVFGNLSGREKRKLFDLLTSSLDPQQLGRVARAIGEKAPEALKEFTASVRGGTQEQKVAYASAVASTLPMELVKSLKDPGLVAAFLQAQNLDSREGYERAVIAFASLDPQGIAALAREHPTTLRSFSLKVQAHQDWYEGLTIDVIRTNSRNPFATVDEAQVQFTREQLQAMREAFKLDDGLITNGELLLAYPDRLERNEAVTQMYRDLSTDMEKLVGSDYANWLTFGIWASDEVGRNMADWKTISAGQVGVGNPQFWLSNGNSKLPSELGPVFKHFIATYGKGDRSVSFEKFWESFEKAYQGRGFSYLEGNVDPRGVDHSGGNLKLDMKNAFKAYHEAMLLHDRKGTAGATPGDDLRRGQLLLYANVLVGLQEQKIIQQDVENGTKFIGITNPGGAFSHVTNVHVPGMKLNLNVDVPGDPAGLTDLNAAFTTSDGQQINIGAALWDRLNGLDGDRSQGDEDEWLRTSTGTDHWEQYDQRMAWIFHFFSSYHTHTRTITGDPRTEWGTRAQNLDTQPEPLIRPG